MNRAGGHTAPTSRIDFAALMPDVALALLGEPNARMSTASEFRYGRRGSLVVHVGGERAGRWHDFEVGEGGGVLDLVVRERGCDRAGAARWLRDAGSVVSMDPALGRPQSRCEPRPGDVTYAAVPKADANERRAWARRTWIATRPLAGTVAEVYLAARGVAHVASAPALRFHPSLTHPAAPGRFPALVAGVQAVTGRFMGIQRTYIAADGTDKAAVDPARASLGSLAGGAVRLAESADGRLLVGEGIESTAAAVLVLDWRHGGAWATLGTPGLRAVELPEHVRDVTIAADRDPGGGGQLAAATLAERLEAEGRHVAIHFSHNFGEFRDFADALAKAMA